MNNYNLRPTNGKMAQRQTTPYDYARLLRRLRMSPSPGISGRSLGEEDLDGFERHPQPLQEVVGGQTTQLLREVFEPT